MVTVICPFLCPAPSLICPANQTIATDHGQSTALVVWTKPSVDFPVEVSIEMCEPASGSKFAIGETKVVCEAEHIHHHMYHEHDEKACHFYVNVTGKLKCMILFLRAVLSIVKCISLSFTLMKESRFCPKSCLEISIRSIHSFKYRFTSHHCMIMNDCCDIAYEPILDSYFLEYKITPNQLAKLIRCDPWLFFIR